MNTNQDIIRQVKKDIRYIEKELEIIKEYFEKLNNLDTDRQEFWYIIGKIENKINIKVPYLVK